jgi:hypothetical protein
MELVGLMGTNASVAGFNNIIANCGRHLFYATQGGNYNLKQNTFYNSNANFARTSSALYFSEKPAAASSSQLNLVLVNNIIWGNLNEELFVESVSNPPVIRHNLIKTRNTSLQASGNVLNVDPGFKDVRQSDFSLSTQSAAANKGEDLRSDPYYNTWLRKDLTNRERLFPSDLGSYEIL